MWPAKPKELPTPAVEQCFSTFFKSQNLRNIIERLLNLDTQNSANLRILTEPRLKNNEIESKARVCDDEMSQSKKVINNF